MATSPDSPTSPTSPSSPGSPDNSGAATAAARGSRTRGTRNPWIIGAICGAAVAFDGYDVVVYGATLTPLREEWHMDPRIAGLVGSSALVGMLVGALLVGLFSSRLGRRTTFITAIAWFSIFVAGCAAAPDPTWFAILRFAAGLGLGAVLPLAASITMENAPEERANLSYVLMQTGFPVGGLAAALLSMLILPHASWHFMYLIAALPLITVVPAALFLLPDSAEEPDGQATSARDGLALLFVPGTRLSTVVFWAMSFCSLLFVYGANTWLPTLMHDAGSTVTKSLGFLLSFNAGAILGGVVAGAAADKFGSKPVVFVSFLLGSGGVIAFALTSSANLLLALAAVTGYGAVATQTLLNGWVTHHYPPAARTRGIGWSLGIGRLGAILGPTLTGLIVAATGGGQAAFFLFAGLAVLGALMALLVRPHPNG